MRMFDNENSDTIATDTNILRAAVAAVAAVLLVAPMFFSEFDSKFFINTIMKDI
jgi:preprotein translocase subunit Sec61beta